MIWYLVIYTTVASSALGGQLLSGLIDCMPGICKWDTREIARVKMPDIDACRAARKLNEGSKCISEAVD
jgi:hypothetical protein